VARVTKEKPSGMMKKVCSRLFDLARMLVRFDHIASIIVNANHSIIYTRAGQTQRTKTPSDHDIAGYSPGHH